MQVRRRFLPLVAACAASGILVSHRAGLAQWDDPSSAAAPTTVTGAFLDENGKWVELAPPHRFRHSGVYDSVRRREVIIGDGSASLWAFPIDDPSAWTRLETQGQGPGPLGSQNAVHDPIADRIIAFGDGSGAVFQLSLGDRLTWSLLEVQGDSPGYRSGHTLILDSHNRVILFGGWDGFDEWTRNEIWILDLNRTPTWSLLTPLGQPPPPRSGVATVYDPKRDQMIVFGGEYGYESTSDCWSVGLAPNTTPTWSKVSPGGRVPEPRSSSAIAYDSDRDRVLIFGGVNTNVMHGGMELDDLVALDLSNTPAWVEVLGSSSGPQGRHGSSLVYNSVLRSAIMYGGRGHVDFVPFSDTWVAHLGAPAWEEVVASVGGRSRAGVAYDSNRQRILVSGGYGDNGCRSYPCGGWSLGDVFAISGDRWELVTSLGPVRCDHAAGFDPVRNRMLIYGGSAEFLSESTIQDDLWSVSLGDVPTVEQIAPLGTPPPGRRRHSMVYDPELDRMVVFGGENTGGPLGDVWFLLLEPVLQWVEVFPVGDAPEARYNHATIYDPLRRRVLIFGGIGATGALADAWGLELTGEPRWTRLEPTGPAPLLAAPLAGYDPDRDRMIVMSGGAGVWALELDPIPVWRTLSPTGIGPTGLFGRRAIYDPARRRVLLTGGRGPEGYSNDLWALSLGRPRRARPMPPEADRALGIPMQNPVRQETRLSIEVAQPSDVRAAIYGVDGRMVAVVAEGPFMAGEHELVWDGRDAFGRLAPSGIYWMRVEVGERHFARKVVCLR